MCLGPYFPGSLRYDGENGLKVGLVVKPEEYSAREPGALWFLRSLRETGRVAAAHPILTTPLPAGLALAFQDGSVHMVHRLSLQTMAVFYSSAPRSLDEPALKRPRTTCPAVHFKAMQLSWTSLALVGIDNHGKVSMRAGRGGGEEEGSWRRGGVGEQCPQHSLPAAQHAANLSIPGPPTGAQAGPAAPAFPAGILHGDRL